jgi:hypothetical protein
MICCEKIRYSNGSLASFRSLLFVAKEAECVLSVVVVIRSLDIMLLYCMDVVLCAVLTVKRNCAVLTLLLYYVKLSTLNGSKSRKISTERMHTTCVVAKLLFTRSIMRESVTERQKEDDNQNNTESETVK